MDSSALEISSQAATAASVCATDVFVFRRVTDDRFVHVGGLGRGEGWAGNVDLVVSEEPLAKAAVETGEPVRIAADEPVPVFGPYYQRFAALVPVSADVIVIFGGGEQGPLEGTDSEICEAAFDRSRGDRPSLARQASGGRVGSPARRSRGRPD